MTTVVAEFDKFRSNRLLVGMCASGGMFQAKVYELLDFIEGVEMYINYILVLSKDFLLNI